MLHRLGDEAAHAGDALLEDRPLGERPAVDPEPRLQLGPDALVRPLGDVLVGAALQVEPAERRRAQAEQREAALVVGVDELVARRRDVGQDAEPAERVVALVRAQHAGRDRRPATRRGSRRSRRSGRTRARARRRRCGSGSGAARPSRSCSATSATSNSSGSPWLEPRARSGPSRPRSGRRSRSQRPPVRSLSGMRWRSPSNCSSTPWWTMPSRRSRSPTPVAAQQVDRALLEHAGADALLDVVAAAVLEHDRLDARALRSRRASVEPGRPRADDPDLRRRITRAARSNSAAWPWPTPTHSVARP